MQYHKIAMKVAVPCGLLILSLHSLVLARLRDPGFAPEGKKKNYDEIAIVFYVILYVLFDSI